jgi:hypothetical protein
LHPASLTLAAPAVAGSHVAETLVRLLCAFALGGFISHRPWRGLLASRAPRLRTETAQTQAIIAVAGALIVIVIGDSLARAFGLVGLGTFIRFRAGVQDPRDVALLFVMIGIGMACGLGLFGTAAVGTGFVALVLMAFDRFAPPRRRKLLVSVVAGHPGPVSDAVRAAFPLARAVGVRREDGATRTAVAVLAGDHEDALTILDRLARHGATDVLALRVEEQAGPG